MTDVGEQQSSEGRGRPRVLLAAGLVVLMAVLAIAARTEQTSPTAPSERIGRQMELTELIAREQARARELEEQVEALSEEIAEYEAAAVSGSAELAELQQVVDDMAAPAGLTDIQGSGVVVTLEDSSLPRDADVDPNNLLIHEEDLRAVVNALWAGGAEAMSINDSRILATTSIRCVGNTLYLNGRLYAPPFEIQAIGQPLDLVAALERDAAVQRFEAATDEYELGYDVSAAAELLVPAHTAPSSLEVAEPASRGS